MMSHDSLGVTLQEIILNKIDDGSLVLPTMPRVALEVRTQLDNPNSELSRIARTLEKDPLLAAQILRLVNSAMYKARDEITSLGGAVTRLGVRRLKEVLYAASARQVFNSRVPQVKEVLDDLWTHSLVVGYLARDVHGIAGSKDSDPAFLAGLLHDVGKAIAAVHLVEFERALPMRQASDWIDKYGFLTVVNDIHRPIGAAVAEEWKLPPAVGKAIRKAGDYDSSDRTSPTNAVRFANALAKDNGFSPPDPDPETTQTEIMIGRSMLGIDDDVIEELVKKLNEYGKDSA